MNPWLAKNWFLVGMPVAVGLAWLFPEAGARGGWMQTEITTKFAVAFVFLAQGLTLPAKALRDGASQWKLHMGVQTFCFVGIPLIGILLASLVGAQLPADLRLGFLFLCVLPSTIVMSVALSTVAGGNVAAAIFNAVLSNVLGVLVTPAWVAWLMKTSSESYELSSVVKEVSMLLLLPLMVGQIGRQVGLKNWANGQKKRLSIISNVIILVIVFAAFCNSVQAGLWSVHGWSTFGLTGVGVVLLLGLALLGAGLVARVLNLAPSESIVMLFCGAQKSLATGVPLAKVIFGAHPGLGLILLPIMVYHPLQLFVCAALGGRHAKRNGVTNS